MQREGEGQKEPDWATELKNQAGDGIPECVATVEDLFM